MRFCWGIEEVIFLRGLNDRYPLCVERNDGETIERHIAQVGLPAQCRFFDFAQDDISYKGRKGDGMFTVEVHIQTGRTTVTIKHGDQTVVLIVPK